MKLTEEQIEAGKSPKGGWTKKQLASWGVQWPPPKGWREKLLRGEEIYSPKLIPSPIRGQIPAHDLLCKVVMAVVNANHASDLYQFPDVLAYFGAKMPDKEDDH